ncbi:MAG: hypothetical protein HY653_05690 [Acidobacteria bacterium]|nr:hypothetical protein [Acidobacteriota bacterium]
MGRQKRFRTRKKHQRRRKRLKEKLKLHEQGQLKRAELPLLAREWLARKRRKQQPTTG